MIRRIARRGINTAKAAGKRLIRVGLWARSATSSRVVLAPSCVDDPALRFLAVGRQGYGNLQSQRVAASMEQAASESPTHGVFYLGDNFYPKGVRSVYDSQWRHKFEWLYCGPHLRGMPFLAVLGNHDAEGVAAAQVSYAQMRLGSARWRMDDRFYAREFGRIKGKALVSAVFLDTVSLRKEPAEQIDFLKSVFTAENDAVWRIVVGHYGFRSVTREPYTRNLTLSSLLPELQALRVDLCLNANDRFQQVIERAGEPLHVSANGGGDKLETGVSAQDPERDFAASQSGFAVIEVDEHAITVELRAADGRVSHRRKRDRAKP